MLVVLPAIAFVLVLLSLRLRSENRSWREAFVAGALVVGTLTVLATEGLSCFRLISYPAIALFWAVVDLCAAGFLKYTLKRTPFRAPILGEKPTVVGLLLLAGIALFVAGTAVSAIVSPPNTWDVMEYHLPKVMHWIQNGSISFYPTAIPRQNHLGPGAEYVLLRLQLLSGSDRCANLVEWCTLVGRLVAVSLIARQLGATVPGQRRAVVFAATLPMGRMQATSTQTDCISRPRTSLTNPRLSTDATSCVRAVFPRWD